MLLSLLQIMFKENRNSYDKNVLSIILGNFFKKKKSQTISFGPRTIVTA